jgi:hypothetical protein
MLGNGGKVRILSGFCRGVCIGSQRCEGISSLERYMTLTSDE